MIDHLSPSADDLVIINQDREYDHRTSKCQVSWTAVERGSKSEHPLDVIRRFGDLD